MPLLVEETALLMKILAYPIYGPAKNLFYDLGTEIWRHCVREMTDEHAVYEKLLELQMRYKLDEITEPQYAREEAKLMGDLRRIKEERQEEHDEAVQEDEARGAETPEQQKLTEMAPDEDAAGEDERADDDADRGRTYI